MRYFSYFKNISRYKRFLGKNGGAISTNSKNFGQKVVLIGPPVYIISILYNNLNY